MTTRVANVDRRGEHLFVSPYSQTTTRSWILDGDPIQLPATADQATVGQAVRDALDTSRQGITRPPRDVDLSRPLLDLVGARSYAQYAKGTTSVGVRATTADATEQIKITPKRNGGARDGFTPLDELAVTIVYDSPGQLGAAVLEALRHAVC